MKFAIQLALMITLLVLSAVPARAADDRPSIGLALSGGGARGLAHVGVLKMLEQEGIPVDYIAGTSMGAVVGGLYAAGYSAEEIESLVHDIDWNQALGDTTPRKFQSLRQKDLDQDLLINARLGFNGGSVQIPLGLVSGQHLHHLLGKELLGVSRVKNFDDLPIPFRAVATDLVTGKPVELHTGSLVTALRASMSVPGVFTPVRHDGRLLVDGGIANNLPVDVVRAMGADIVIAVDISTPLFPEEMLDSVLRVTEQITSMLTRNNTEAQIALLTKDDLLIVPNLIQVGSASFDLAEHAISTGVVATEQALVASGNHLPRLISADRISIDKGGMSPLRVAFIEVDNNSNLRDEILLSRLRLRVGEVLDLDALNEDVQVLYGLGYFQRVHWEPIVNEKGESGVRIIARQRTWGPNYLQFGLNLSGDFSGDNDFTLGAAYTRTGMNTLGGELRGTVRAGSINGISLDFYQPLDKAANWFLNPIAFYNRRPLNVFIGDQKAGELAIESIGLSAGIGRNFSSTGRLRLDVLRFDGDIDVLSGIVTPVKGSFNVGEALFSGTLDTLDSLDFPEKGARLNLALRLARKGLGSDGDYEQLEVDYTRAWTRNRNTLLLRGSAGYSLNSEAPVERFYELGGFANLSGLIPNQLSGPHYGLFTLSYYRRLGNIDFLPAYAGVTLETGNTFMNRDDVSFSSLRRAGSLFIGVDSPIGPIYLSYGKTEDSDGTFYLFLGNPFRTNLFRF